MGKLKFEPGRIFVAPDALAVMANRNISFSTMIANHLDSDWGDLADEYQGDDGFFISSLFSAQKIPGGEIWVTTELDQQVTTIQLPV